MYAQYSFLSVSIRFCRDFIILMFLIVLKITHIWKNEEGYYLKYTRTRNCMVSIRTLITLVDVSENVFLKPIKFEFYATYPVKELINENKQYIKYRMVIYSNIFISLVE